MKNPISRRVKLLRVIRIVNLFFITNIKYEMMCINLIRTRNKKKIET